MPLTLTQLLAQQQANGGPPKPQQPRLPPQRALSEPVPGPFDDKYEVRSVYSSRDAPGVSRYARISRNVQKMLDQGAPEADIDAYLHEEAVTPAEIKKYNEGRKANNTIPNFVRFPSQGHSQHYLDEVIGGAEGMFQRGVNLYRHVTGQPIELTGDKAGEMTRAAFNDTYAQERQLHPIEAGVGEFIGAAAHPINRVGGKWIGAGKGILSQTARSAVFGAGSGAIYGSGQGNTVQERAQNATTGAVWGGGIGAVIPPAGVALGAGVNALRRPPRVSPDVALLRERGVPLTYGQARGGGWKVAEDAATSFPILGPKIQEARTASIQGYDKAVLNNALDDIATKLPDDIEAGHASNAFAKQQFSDFYNNLAPDQPIMARDPAFHEMAPAVPDNYRLSDKSISELDKIMEINIGSKVDEAGALAGREYKDAIAGLKQERDAYARSPYPEDQRMKQALDDHIAGLERLAMEQDPYYAQMKGAADRGFAKFATAESAGARQGAEGGVFTPSHHDSAIRAADTSVRHGRYASGEALGQDFATAGRRVLPSKMPNSGTADRVGIISPITAVMGGFAAGGPIGAVKAGAAYAAGAGLLKGASTRYSPEALARFNAALDRQIAAAGAPQPPRKPIPVAPVVGPSASAASGVGTRLFPPQPVDLPTFLREAAAEEEDKKRTRKKE